MDASNYRGLARIALALTMLLLITARASAYSVNYDYYVYARDPVDPNTPVAEDVTLTGQASVSGGLTLAGTTLGNYATVAYAANLATGSIQSYAYSLGYDDGYTSTGRVESIGFQDTIIFTVPAGTYDSGVSVHLAGTITGAVSSTTYAGAMAGYSISFGGELFSLSAASNVVGINESDTLITNEIFLLSVELVAPGSVVNSVFQIPVLLNAGLYNNETWTVEHLNVHDTYTAVGEVDFFNTLSFTSLEVPTGIDWTSESGVFLTSTTSPALPLPSAMLLFLSGLAGLGAVGWRERIVRLR